MPSSLSSLGLCASGVSWFVASEGFSELTVSPLKSPLVSRNDHGSECTWESWSFSCILFWQCAQASGPHGFGCKGSSISSRVAKSEAASCSLSFPLLQHQAPQWASNSTDCEKQQKSPLALYNARQHQSCLRTILAWPYSRNICSDDALCCTIKTGSMQATARRRLSKARTPVDNGRAECGMRKRQT